MADTINIVPPVDTSEETLDEYYVQVCDLLNDISNSDAVVGPDSPDDVTGLSASGGYGLNTITFDEATYYGHRYTLIMRSLDGTIGSAVLAGTTSGTIFYDGLAEPDINATYTYFAKHMNTDGDKSTNWTSGVSCTLLTESDYAVAVLEGKVGIDEMKPDNFPVRKVTVLPSLPDANYPEGCLVYLTTSSKIYRNAAGTWTKEIEVADVSDAGDLASKDRTDLDFVDGADVTADNTAADTSAVAGVAASTVATNAADGATFTSSDAGDFATVDTISTTNSSTLIEADAVTKTHVDDNAMLSSKQLTVAANGSYSETVGTETITHNLGRYAVANAWSSGDGTTVVHDHTTTEFKITYSVPAGDPEPTITVYYAYI